MRAINTSDMSGDFNSIQFNFYFDFVNIYMIEIHHWPANSKELIEAGQWLQLIHVSSWNCEIQGIDRI